MQINSDEIELHLETAGSGDPILFLHGFPDHGGCWLPVMRGFEDHQVARLDARGHGHSKFSQRIEDYCIEKLVADVLVAMDYLNEGPLTLVGHDWGGVVAWFLAAAHPERVAHLVIINAPHPTLFAARLRDHEGQREASTYIERLIAADDAGVLTPERLWEVTLGGDEMDGLISPEERQSLLRSWAQPGAIRAMVNWYRAASFLRGGDMPALSPIEVPTLVIWGEQDELLLPVLLEGLEHEVRQLTICRVEDAGHGIVRQQPQRVVEVIRGFLAQPASE
jgi:pimeloyl-ACP methyl ester carboxylesterase